MAARRQNQDPTQGERRFVSSVLLRGEEPLYIKWVTKRKRDKIQDRLLVVGKYRVFSIKKTVTGKKQIQRVAHLFDLVSINSPDVDRAILQFKEFEIDATEQGAGTELITTIRKAFQQISYHFADYAIPRIVLQPAERQVPELPQIDPGTADGLLETYKAWCDYYKSPPNQEFMKWVTELAALGVRELCMEKCPGFERRGPDSINFVPIKAALRHNTYFTTFTLKDVSRKEVAAMMADTLTHNITLTKVQLDNVDASEQAIASIGEALKKNEYNNLQDLDISNNPNCKDKGIFQLSEALLTLKHSLQRLNVAYCGLTSRGVSQLVQSFVVGAEVGVHLTDLDLSHNSLSMAGSVQLSNWFNKTGQVSLRYLYLASTKLDVALVAKGLKSGMISSLEEIDISGNRMDLTGAQALASVIDISPHLTLLNLSFCGLLPAAASTVLSSIAQNGNIREMTVNLSGNEQLSVQGAQNIAQVIANSSNITSLIMRNCGFKKEGLGHLVEALGRNQALKMFDISLNFHSGSLTKMSKLMNQLADAVKRHPTLEHLAIAGDNNKACIGKEILPLLKTMADNPSVTELDVSGNRFGDPAAVELCDALKNNVTLKLLSWDKNGINIGGWQALLQLISSNRTLQSCAVPVHDVDKAIRESKNKEVFKEKTQDLMNKIQDTLKKNISGESYTSQYVKKRQGRSYTAAYMAAANRQSTVPSATGSPPTSPRYPPSNDYYDTPAPYTDAPPPPPMVYGTLSPNTARHTSMYDQPPPRPYSTYDMPPPPVPADDSYTAPPVPSHGDYYGDTSAQDYNYDYNANYLDEYAQEYDDSVYEDGGGAPPPPPPPPY